MIAAGEGGGGDEGGETGTIPTIKIASKETKQDGLDIFKSGTTSDEILFRLEMKALGLSV